jgi:hypothetical protein
LDRNQLAHRLLELGLWRDLDAPNLETNMRAVRQGTHPWATELAESVMFFADGEELAEDGVEEFINDIAPFVAQFGVQLHVSTATDNSDGEYAVVINGKRVELYIDSLSINRSDDSFPWYAATVRPLAEVNRLLSAEGADVRFFTLYAGANDGIALLLDPEIVHLMTRIGFDEREIPRLCKL